MLVVEGGRDIGGFEVAYSEKYKSLVDRQATLQALEELEVGKKGWLTSIFNFFQGDLVLNFLSSLLLTAFCNVVTVILLIRALFTK